MYLAKLGTYSINGINMVGSSKKNMENMRMFNMV